MSLNSTQLREHLWHLTKTNAPSWKMPLWDYALALYAQEEVRVACLRLQDESAADVCELLWICWLGCHGLAPGQDALHALAPIRHWQRETTQQLRALRRWLKPQAITPGLESLRETIKRAELQAEREALTRLQQLSEGGQGIHLLEQNDPSLSLRLLEWLSTDDECTQRRLAVLETHFNRPMVET